MKLTLVDERTGELAELPVIGIYLHPPTILVRWGMAGLYEFDLGKNLLDLGRNPRRRWRAKSELEAWCAWYWTGEGDRKARWELLPVDMQAAARIQEGPPSP